MSVKKPPVAHVDDFKHQSAIRLRRVMIVGASGYVGSALALGLRDEFEIFASHNRSPLWIEGVHSFKIDVLQASEILHAVQRYQPDIVIYCAGVTTAQTCEANPMIADAINSRSLSVFLKVLPRPIPFMYLSCDQVFSGEGTDLKFRFNEDDDANPLNELTSSKVRGEGIVLQHNRLTYVLRLAHIYGERLGSPQRPRDSWIQKFIEVQGNEKFSLLEDQRRSSVYIGDVVRGIRRFLHNIPLTSTLFHLSASDALSEREKAELVFAKWSLDVEKIVPQSLEERITAQGFKETKFSAMSAKRFENLYSFQFQSFADGVKELRERLETGHTQNWL